MKKKQAERECQCEEQTHNFDVKTGIRAEQREEPRRGRGQRGLQSQSGSSEGRGGGVRGREGGRGSCGGGQRPLMFRQLCIMNEALIMIAPHLWTEHGPAAEPQDRGQESQ